MNKKFKYCSIFLLVTVLLILSSSMVSASDINDNNAEIMDDTITKTVSDNTDIITQTDNKESQTIKNEVEKTSNTNTTTTSNKQLNKTDKNIKKVNEAQITLTPDTANIGDTVTIVMDTDYGTSFYAPGDYNYVILLNNTEFLTGTVPKPGNGMSGSFTIIVPEYQPGTYEMYIKITNANKPKIGAEGFTTFTIANSIIETIIEPIDTITEEYGTIEIPVRVTEHNGNLLTGTSTITVKDGDTVLVEGYPIEEGWADVTVPVNRVGDYDLTVEFMQTFKYAGSSTTVPVSISPAQTRLMIDQTVNGNIYESVDILNKTLITGKLIKSNTYEAIANVEITLNVNGRQVKVNTNNQGKFNYSYDMSTIGRNLPISVVFEGNDNYLESNLMEGSFDAESLPVNINLERIVSAEVDEVTTITGSVMYNNNPVADVPVILNITGIGQISTTTDSNGKFTYDATFNQMESITVTASIVNELYSANSTQTTFNVVGARTKTNLVINTGIGSNTNIDIEGIRPYFNEEITSGTLTDIDGNPMSGASVTILINGEDFSQTTDGEGKFTLIYNATEGLTSYNINVVYEGNDDYEPSQNYTGTFNTQAFEVAVIIDRNFPSEILIGDELTVSGSATLQEAPLKNANIQVYFDGRRYNVYTDDNGIFTKTFTVERNGTIRISAKTTYANANVQEDALDIFVDKPEVIVSLENVEDMLVGEEITLNVHVYISSNNTGIKDSVEIKINDEIVNKETDDNGYLTYIFTPEEIGEYNVSIGYSTNRYAVTNTSASINVNKRQTKLISDKLPIAVKVGDSFNITGKLVDQKGEPVSNQLVEFIVNDEIYTNTTDVNGHYNYSYITSQVGDNNLYEVLYNGNNQYYLARNYVGSFFDVEDTLTIVTINYTKESSTFTITGKVLCDGQAPSENSEVKIIIDDESEETVYVDAEGTFTYTYRPEALTTHKIFAKYQETTSNTLTIKQDKLTTETQISDFTPIVGKNTTIKALVSDDENNPITEGKVVFKINGKTLKDENDKVIYIPVENGEAIISNYPVPESWKNPVNITAVYSGSSSYMNSKANITVQAQTLNATITLTQNSITAKSNSTITITASIKNNLDENINDGKVILKLNGKTTKDENGKVIYINVTDGQISYDYNIPTTLKEKTYTLTVVYTSTSYNRCEDIMNLSINNTITANTSTNTLSGKKLLQDNPTTHIITNDNVDEYINENGLSDLVQEGDTLDIQGLIDRTHSLVINKPINVISSTQDAIINLHTVAGSLNGEDPGNSFVVNNAGSGSNISSLYLNNTECWIFNTYDVTLYNMTMHVQNARVGSGVGQTAIRYSERITIDSCYVYTESNGGSTSMALTGSSDVLIKNTTIHGVQGDQQVGNILYLANPYNQNDIPTGFIARNTNITLVNSTLLGECTAAITVAVKNFASQCSFINNTINTTGDYGHIELGSGGKAIGNQFYNEGGLLVNSKGDVINNTFYDDSKMKVEANANMINNTVSYVEYHTSADLSKNNTIHNIIMYENTQLSNTTIEGNVILNVKVTLNPISNINITNNTIKGNVDVLGRSRTSRCDKTLIENNNVGGNITLSYAQSTTIKNNTINGTVSITNSSFYTNITNNTIITDNEYAIINTISYTNMTNNYLLANNKAGADAINSSNGKIEGNGPEKATVYYINIDEVNAISGDVTTITVNIIDPQDRIVEEGQVYLMINNEILVDENDNPIIIAVTQGQAIFENIEVQEEWLRSNALLQAVFKTENTTKLNSTTMNINKREAQVEITTETLTFTQGQTITLQARVTDNEQLINGQLTFKLNGKSLKDDDNQLIYVDVIDGIATLEYTLPEYLISDTYTLTAVFKNQTYVRSVASEDMIIE